MLAIEDAHRAIEVADGGPAVVVPVNPARSLAVAVSYRAAVAVAQAALESMPGYASYSSHVWLDGSDYFALVTVAGLIRKAAGLRTHDGRLRVLADAVRLSRGPGAVAVAFAGPVDAGLLFAV